MSKNEIVYSRTQHPKAEGRTYRNPRHFVEVEKGAKKVFIDGDFPDIASAYEAAGVRVEQLNPLVDAQAKGAVTPALKLEAAVKIAQIGEQDPPKSGDGA